MSTLAHARQRLGRAGGAVLDLLLPPRCLRCGGEVGGTGSVCGACWGALTFLGPPCCACCGLPFPYEPGGESLCGACLREPPPFARARAALRYDDESRGLILGFKHRDRAEAAPLFARWMAAAGADLLADADLVAPVPLHWTRLFARRFNQSALLALRLGKGGGVPVCPDLLVRRRRTPSQGRRNAAQRADNVRGAFALHRRRGGAARGRRILLVDDVFTTGATVSSCASALLRGGAAAVDVLTLARVVRAQTM